MAFISGPGRISISTRYDMDIERGVQRCRGGDCGCEHADVTEFVGVVKSVSFNGFGRTTYELEAD